MKKTKKISLKREFQETKKYIIYTKHNSKDDSRQLVFLNKMTLLIEKVYRQTSSERMYMEVEYDMGRRPTYIKKVKDSTKLYKELFPKSQKGKTLNTYDLKWNGDAQLLEYEDHMGNWWSRERIQIDNPFDLDDSIKTLIYIYDNLYGELMLNRELLDILESDVRKVFSDSLKQMKESFEELSKHSKTPQE